MRPNKDRLQLLKHILSYNRPTGMIEMYSRVTGVEGHGAAYSKHSVRAYIDMFMQEGVLNGHLSFPLYEKQHVMVFRVQKGDKYPNRMFTCHVDTVDRSCSNQYSKDSVVESYNELCGGHYLHLRTGTQRQCLGADDGAGMAIMFEMMMQGIEGYYAFFADEEVGMLGSKQMVKDSPRFLETVEHIVSFDRKDSDVVTTQMGYSMCNVETADALTAHFVPEGYANDSYGMFTDSAAFWPKVGDYSGQILRNCVNIGTGYSLAHSKSEVISNSLYLHTLQKALTCDWDNVLQHGTKLVEDTFGDLLGTVSGYLDEDIPKELGEYANLNAAPSTAASLFEHRTDVSDVIDAVWNRLDDLDDDDKRAQLCRLVDYVVDTIANNPDILRSGGGFTYGAMAEGMSEFTQWDY